MCRLCTKHRTKPSSPLLLYKSCVIFLTPYIHPRLNLISIYKCLCDETRLRILNLLSMSPLCVCHLQSVIDSKSQVVISQHLAYLRERGMVSARRHRQWMIYSLPQSPSHELEKNLKCLQDCGQTEPVFLEDRKRLQEIIGAKSVQALLDEGCCPSPAKASES